MAVLFASCKALNRAENIKTLFDAYCGEKEFVQMSPRRSHPEITSGKYSLLVADEFPAESPGKVILIRHGIDGGKTYGLDQPHPYVTRRDTELLTFVVITGTKLVKMAARQCGVSEEAVLPLGMPRTDAYFGRKKGDGGTSLKNVRAYLYAPTYRGTDEPPLPSVDWNMIDGLLEDGEVMVVKPHTMTGSILRGTYRHIQEVSPQIPSAGYLIDCDVLITDYSTILFDAHVLQKPVVLFEKSKGYPEQRGMYFKYPEEYASRYCENERELISMVRSATGQGEADIRCRELAADMCDGHSTERILNLIRRMA